MTQELLDQIQIVKVQVTALKERVADLQDMPAPPSYTYTEEEFLSDGTNVISVVIPSSTMIIGIILIDLGLRWANRNIKITNISKKVVGSNLHLNLFLSQNAPDKSYLGKVSYYTPTP